MSVDTASTEGTTAAEPATRPSTDGAAAPRVPSLPKIASHLHATPSWDVADFPVPKGREEIWRFTPLKRLRGLLEAEATGDRLQWQTTLPESVTLTRISGEQARALGGRAPMDRLAVLAAANADGAVRVDIPAETEVTTPVILTLTGTGAETVVHEHLVITVGHHATATIVLEHRGSATYDAYVSVLVGDGATVNLVELQLWDDDAVHTGQTSVRVGRDASVTAVTATLGGDLVRLTQTTDYAGVGGELHQYGVYFADAGQHLEHRLLVDHATPKSVSRVDYRGALQGEGAHTVWIGDVLIRKTAEGIDTYETDRNLVLTDGCRADAVPNLEIETGEIGGAGHSATTGRFDDEQLFYLQSRGIPEAEARRLVVFGFFTEIITKIGVPDIEQRLLAAVTEELSATVGAPAPAAPVQA
ncbi:Fe-S cluster assembly protein SufD [Raineyella sp. W15-4]|uniref:Fe-S cluster assembly protein SufD n=1 Tax=Raineyella sp. W15-4 TaxID=3081651 RepID=UPI00295490FC|nr:Fe-S cluster assembly protein SufD [Raineyella sp. W15-4]WOQ18289.1 Fe-S cluster assembly protein SufD [Raineyella sp. W15-4]